jgi:hypothetical protein
MGPLSLNSTLVIGFSVWKRNVNLKQHLIGSNEFCICKKSRVLLLKKKKIKCGKKKKKKEAHQACF